jgi:CubicO group peptidase (beta-lactamase class C family)
MTPRSFPALIGLLLPAALLAQADHPAARRAREFVALVNGSAPEAFKAYVDSAFGDEMRRMPMDAHQGFLFRLRDQSRGLTWIRAEGESPVEATAVVEQKLTGERTGLVVRIEDKAPYRIVGLGGRPVAGEASAKISTDAEMAAALEQFVSKLAGADLFSGTVLIARDGKVLWSKAYGEANKDFGAPNKLDTKFNLGSMNKMFTSVVIAQLVEEGKLSYEDPLAKFLPSFPTPEAAKKIRIKHLLTHTSGLGSYFNDEFDRSSRARFRTVDDMLTLARNDSLAFEPGTRWSYSNTGMLVLGKVIEVATGQDYFQYVRDHIYRPAGMVNSDAYELDRVNPNLAVGYEKVPAPDGSVSFQNNIFMHVIRGGPAGGGYSTAADLLAFAEAFKSGKLVSRATYELMTAPKPELSSPNYGYGFQTGSGSAVGHSGGFPGISSNLDIFKGTGYVGVVLSNYGSGAQPVVQKIRQLVAARGGPKA